MKRLAILLPASALLLLSACGSGGPVRRVSEPAASIQQLTVRADGSWSVQLRIDNYSNVPMRFGAVRLDLAVGGQAAGALQGDANLVIGPESADVATLAMAPSSGVRVLVADALAARRSLPYALTGTLHAAPADGGQPRGYGIDRDSALSPVPGLPGVLR
jgi:hypothetical protein